MGDKSNKRRPGREAERLTPPPRVLVVRVGDFWVSVDTRTGMIECPHDDGLSIQERNLVTSKVIDVLTSAGLPPLDKLQVRDALFG